MQEVREEPTPATTHDQTSSVLAVVPRHHRLERLVGALLRLGAPKPLLGSLSNTSSKVVRQTLPTRRNTQTMSATLTITRSVTQNETMRYTRVSRGRAVS